MLFVRCRRSIISIIVALIVRAWAAFAILGLC